MRPYQDKLVTATRNEIKAGHKNILLVLSTGAGKTAILFDICRRAVEKGHRVLLLIHRRDLAFQTVAKFKEYGKEYGIDAGLIMAGTEDNLDKSIQVVSVWTYNRRLKLDPLEINRFYVNASLVLIDEAHRSLSKVFRDVMSNYQDKITIGVTATPCLSSGAAMGAMYDSLVDEVSIKELINNKYLVPCIYYGGSAPDTKGMNTTCGDWDKKELGEKSDKPKLIGDIVENWLRLASDRQTILFAVNRKHGKHLLEAFADAGVRAAYLDAHSSDADRAVTLTRFANKEIQMIINVALFQEFLDAPITSCIDIAKATKSMGLYRQMIGRGLRPYPGKTNCMVIDHGDCILGQKLGFIEDDIEWTLDGKQQAWKKRKVIEKEKVVMTCEECQNLFYGHICPRCGMVVKEYNKKIATAEAELKKLTRGKKRTVKKTPATVADKQRFYGMLKLECAVRGYAHGWIANQYRARFGVWPIRMGDAEEVLPDRAFKNFLTWQRIRYFKGKGRNKK